MMRLTKRSPLIASMAGLAILSIHAVLSATELDDKSPNLVLIIADNLGRESVGTYGGNLFSTPRIDAIGREGVIFDQCYIGTPLCSPARAGLMTGRYPQWAGVYGQPNPKLAGQGNLAPDEVTLAQTLKAAGYHTGLFGKWNLGYDERLLPTRRGFDTYYGINAGHADYYTHIYNKDGKKHFYRDITRIDPVGYVDNLCVDEALDWLDSIERSAHAFFLEVAFFTPHGPYQPPPGYPGQGSDEEIYGYMIENMDKNVGRIIDKLHEVGVADDTLVVFISDQGASFKNPYKRDLTEGGLKVVCHAAWPGHTVPGTRVVAPIVSYDWFTTLTELGGGKIPSDRIVVGKNVSHLFGGHGLSPHETFFWTFRNEDAIRQGDWKLHMVDNAVQGLYDLAEDPEARRDVSSDHPEKVQELRRKIAMHKAQDAVRVGNTGSGQKQPMSTEELLRRTPPGVTVVPDIAYREGNEAWKLDLAMPKERGDEPRPAIIYIHGGGWTKGDKRGQGIDAVLNYATKGFVSISVNYRLDVDKIACIEDVKCATRWLRAHAEQYNVDPDRIGAAGNSAGGHLALMLAVCPASAGLEGDGPYQDYSSRVQSAHCSSTPIMPRFRRGRGAGQDVRKIQPMTYISANLPPLYLIHGALDQQKAPVSDVDGFVKALREAGAQDITYKRYADTGHGAYVKHIEEARASREAFLVRTLRK